ncbi:MAG: PorV/PorQ family protein [bacterium]
MRIVFKTIIVLISGILFSNIVFSAGATTADFLQVNISARETAIGGVYTPFYAYAGSSIINPATLAGIDKSQVIMSHYSSVFETRYEQILYALPLNEKEAVGGVLMYDGNDNLQRTDIDGNPIEKIDNFDIIVGGIYSKNFGNELSTGIIIKGLMSRLYKANTYGISMNVGIVYNNKDRHYVLGLVLENIGITTVYSKEQSMLPLVVRGGYGLELYNDKDTYKSSLYIEEMVPINEIDTSETSLGLEVIYLGFMAFRYGYIFGIAEGRVSIGAGIKLGDFTLDYAYKPFFVSDNEHRVTLRAEF